LKNGRLNGASRTDLSYPLYEFLNSLVPLLSFAVLIIDEAQNLSLPLLEELRILSDLEAPEKLLQVVMVGQLEFRSKLQLPEMRQLDQRVSVRCSLEALSRDGVAGYIAHRLNVAGGGSNRVEFTSDAVTVIDRASAGVPRVINRICDRALYQGYLSRKARIDAETASSAIAHLGLRELIPSKARAFVPDERDTLAREMAALVGPLMQPPTDDLGVHDLAGPFYPTMVEPHGPPLETDAPTQPVVPRWRRRTPRLVAVAASLSVMAAAWTALPYVQREFIETPAMQAPPPPPAWPLAAPFEPSIPPDAAIPSTAPPDTRPPEVPRTVSQAEEGSNVIDAALFESRTRAERSVEELTAAGYRARWAKLDLGSDRDEYLVFVGGYATRADAEPDLARIRAIPGYADARVVAAPPSSTAR
jgi:hypothetical protein